MRASPARGRPFLAAALASLLTFVRAPLPAGDVIFSELHYDPPDADGRFVEFIELYNRSGKPVDLSGWQLEGEVEQTLPPGSVLPSNGYLVLARNKADLEARFRGIPAPVVGDFDGSLANGGGRLELRDAQDAQVDFLVYGDEAPWPTSAAGDGDSIQRRCLDSESRNPLSWVAAAPTPGQAAASMSCPPPSHVPAAVVINELQYRPASPYAPGARPSESDGEEDEFLELYNTSTAAIDLGGWRLDGGIELQFEPGTLIQPLGYLIVARDPARWQARDPGLPVVSTGYTGRLSNRGERLALLDFFGAVVDSVVYGDSGDWPFEADGGGYSLARIDPLGPSWDPSNWRASSLSTEIYYRLVGEGPIGQGLVQKVVLALDGAGVALVDNVLLEDVTDPSNVQVILEERFEAGAKDWSASGTLSGSAHAPGQGEGGGGAYRLVAAGPCPNGECGSANSVSRSVSIANRGGRFRFSIAFKHLSGSAFLSAGLFKGASVSLAGIQSPGLQNPGSTSPPITISGLGRFPRQPRSEDPVWLSAVVRASAAPTVTLTYDLGFSQSAVTVAMADDGQHGDHLAGDGVYGAELPPQPHSTKVRFSIRAATGDSVTESPPTASPGSRRPSEYWGYYVNDLQTETPLRTYQLLLDQIQGSDYRDVNALLGSSCSITVPGSFAYKGTLYPDVQVRFRGNTACLVKKRNFKVAFNHGRYFRGVRKLNINSEWTDKSMVREHLAWDLCDEIGSPYVETEFIRLHLNGSYFGLYLQVEHPDTRFLSRNGLDSSGNLYKSKQPPQGGTIIGVAEHASAQEYRAYWEEETNEGGDYSDITSFVGQMHDDAFSAGGPTAQFWQTQVIPEMILRYQISQVVLDNVDSFAKNHFLYHDLSRDHWGFITWDLDLTFGKFFCPNLPGVCPDAINPAAGREVGTLNDVMQSDVGFDLNPWFGATVLQNPLYNYLVDYFFRAGGGLYQRAYLVRLWRILQEKYRPDTYAPRLEDLSILLAQDEAQDREQWGRYPSNVPGFPEDMQSNISILLGQLNLHRQFLLGYLQAFHAPILDAPRLKITELMYAPETGDDDLEFLEIWNPGESAVDVAGWSISAVSFTFPAGASVAAGQTILVARDPGRLRDRYPNLTLPDVYGPYTGKLSNSGEEVTLLDAGPGFPAAIDFVHYEDGGAWPAARPGHSIELTQASLDRDNDRPENWVASSALGGTPGTHAPTFLRGDGNDDKKLGLTDAVVTLGYLFQGGAAPVCLDAADSNDDGKLDLTDAVYLLQFLFMGGPSVPPPYPEPGSDPTQDALGC